jgi:hypothetical protein
MSAAVANAFVSPDERHALHICYYRGFTSADEFVFTVVGPHTAQLSAADIQADMRRIQVVPNPFLVNTQLGQVLMFTNMPAKGRLRIFSVSGQFLQQIEWQEGSLSQPGMGAHLNAQGDLLYNMRTHEDLLLASGLYLFVVEALDASNRTIARKNGKFVIVR